MKRTSSEELQCVYNIITLADCLKLNKDNLYDHWKTQIVDIINKEESVEKGVEIFLNHLSNCSTK